MKRLLLLSLVSFAFFFANGQALQLEHPTKGDVWTAFSLQKIQWQSANVDNIKIEVSTDTGRTWSVIQASYPASATSYNWTIPGRPSDSCFIRITDIENADIISSNYPSNPFRIPKPIVELDPLEIVSVSGRTALPITWTSTGVKSVRLLASYNNKLSFQVVANGVPAVQQVYNWVVKDSSATNCFLLIQSVDNPTVTDTTNEAFSIRKLTTSSTAKYRGGSFDGHSSGTNVVKRIRLVTPNNPEELTANTAYSINWTTTAIEKVTLRYSTDSGSTWKNIATNISTASSTFNWTVPATPSASCLVKILDASDSTVFDISDTAFTINTSTLYLLAPEENETAYRGRALQFNWKSSGVSMVKIEYYDRAKWNTLTNSIDAAGEVFNWVVPATISDSVKIKVSDANNPAIADSVLKIFFKRKPSISSAKYRGGSYDGHSSATNKNPTLLLLLPNENMKLSSATKYNIIWKSFAVSSIDIAFSADSGRTWENIVTSYINSDSYHWTVPAIASATCLIRIRSSEDSTLSDLSDAVFTILPSNLNLITDTETPRYMGTAMPLEWEQKGLAKVSLSYKTTIDGTWLTIKDGIDANISTINWVLPAIPNDSLWIKIVDYSDLVVSDEQLFTGIFKRIPSFSATKYRGGSFDGHSFRSNNNRLSILTPAANDTLTSGSTFPITWNNQSVSDSVLLQYSIDSGRTWINIGASPADAGRYNWVIPSTPAGRSEIGVLDDCMVRAVEKNAGNEVVGINKGTFSIVQSVTLPVSIVSLKGKLSGDIVKLEWVAENEINFDWYQVERSTDAITYQKIGEVKADNLRNYSYNDNTSSLGSGQLFYRLRKVDKDGQFTYTSVVPVNIPGYGKIFLYPNPVNDRLTIKIKTSVAGTVKVQVLDAIGKVVQQLNKNLNGNTLTLNTNRLTSGTYYVKISYNGQEFTRKVIVVK